MRCAVNQMKDQRQRRKQLIELRQTLSDERLILARYSRPVDVSGPFDEDGLSVVVEAEVGELGEVVRRSRAPGPRVEVRQRLEDREGSFSRRLVWCTVAPPSADREKRAPGIVAASRRSPARARPVPDRPSACPAGCRRRWMRTRDTPMPIGCAPWWIHVGLVTIYGAKVTDDLPPNPPNRRRCESLERSCRRDSFAGSLGAPFQYQGNVTDWKS